MTPDAHATFNAAKPLASGFIAGLSLLVAPEVALAEAVNGVVGAVVVSGVAGTALGATVSGLIGYGLFRREFRTLRQQAVALAHGAAAAEDPAVGDPASADGDLELPADGAFEGVPAPAAEPAAEPVRGIADGPVRPGAPAPADRLRESLGAIPDPLAEPVVAPRPVVPRAHGASRPEAPRHRIPAVPTGAPPAAATGSRFRSAPATPVAPPARQDRPAPQVTSPALDPALARLRERRRARGGAAAPTDYGAVAAEYVARKGFKERMGVRARGVAAVLGERMGRNMMEGMPVIERADGSVADVGTTWWEQSAQIQHRPAAQPLAGAASAPAAPSAVPTPAAHPVSGAVGESPSMPRPVQARLEPTPAAPPPRGSSPAPEPLRPSPAPFGAAASPATPRPGERSRLITRRIAFVEEEAYPEIVDRRSQADGDLWEQALAALDRQVEDNLMAGREGHRRRRGTRPAHGGEHPGRAPVAAVDERRSFEDAVGTVETLDEPDGLEQDTAFLNFRAPGNHPEVQDTGSYINYLIQDEFKHNPSSNARRQARSYLRVHEGGHTGQAQAL